MKTKTITMEKINTVLNETLDLVREITVEESQDCDELTMIYNNILWLIEETSH